MPFPPEQHSIQYMQKDIDLQQIINVLNFSTTDNDHTSFRLSDDYQPNYFRYSKDDQLQEITFNLEGEDEQGFQIGGENQLEVKIKEESQQDRICFILEDTKEEPVKPPPPQEKPHDILKKTSLNRKTSIRASELLKRKISLKKENDQFGKKYDDLFDEIFFKERAKKQQEEQKKEPPKKEVQGKKEESLISTNENLSGSNVTSNTSETNFSISRAIDEAIVNGFNSLTKIAQPKNPNPKVMITYETKILINIRPPKESVNTEAVQTNNAKPKIKFSYGQTQAQIAAKKPVLLEGVPNQIKEENRLPQFLLAFRSKTNNYPNFYSKNGFTYESCENVNKQFVQILQECKKSIQTLKQSHFALHQLFNNIKQLYKLLSINILNHKSKEDQALLDYFLSHPWSDYLKTKQLQAIRPRDYFLARPFNELEFITFINGFEEVALRLQSEALLDADNPETIKAYMSGRDQLWAIEKNLRLLSEDLYLYAISHFNLPSHFIQTHSLLKSVKQNEKLTMNAENEQLLKRLLFLQENKDILGSSWVGHYAVECLCALRK